MSSNKILVTGATGTVGGAVVRQLAEAGADVRALTRKPENTPVFTGVELAAGDLSDPASLEEPLRDVDSVFLIWPFLSSEGVDGVLDVVRGHARRVVYLSAYGVDLERTHEPNPILRFHRDLEHAVRGSGLEWVNLRPASFAANTRGWAAQLHEGLVRQPFRTRRQALIHEADIAAVAVRALTRDELLAITPVLTGPESLAPDEQVAVLGEALGLPADFEEISAPEARENAIAAGWPEGIADALFDGGELASQETTPGVESVVGRPPRSLRQWALDHASEFR